MELHRSDNGRSTDSTRTGVLSCLHPIIPHECIEELTKKRALGWDRNGIDDYPEDNQDWHVVPVVDLRTGVENYDLTALSTKTCP